MSHLGDFALGKTFDTKFTTVTTTGAPTVLAGSPVVSAYVDNSTTQLTAGITLSVDFDGVVGLNNIRVVATSGNGYAAAGNYQLVITTGTVGGTSVVGYVVAEFSIEARSSLRPTTADRALDVSAGGEAGLDWANIGSPTTAQNLSATNIDVDQVVASVSGAVGSVTGAVGSVAGNVGGNVVGSVASVTAGVTLAASAIQAIWDAATSALTTVGSIGKLLIDNINATIGSRSSHSAADVWSVVTRVLTAGTNIVLAKGVGVTGFNDLDAAGTRTAVGLASANLDTQLTTIDDFLDTEVADIQARLPAALVGGRMDSNMQAAGNGVITALVVATDAIDSDALAPNAITEIQNGLATAAALATVSGFVDTEIATLQADVSAILADTGTDGVVVATASKTGYALSAAGVDEIFDELRAGHNVVGSYGESFFTLESGAAIAGTLSTTQMSTNLTEATDDHYKGRIVFFTSGALLRQGTDITAYNGTTKVLTFTALTEAPTAADKFVIV